MTHILTSWGGHAGGWALFWVGNGKHKKNSDSQNPSIHCPTTQAEYHAPPLLKILGFGRAPYPILLLYPQKGWSIHIGSPTLPDQIRHNNQLFPGAGAHSIKDTPLAQLAILAVIRTVDSSCFEHSRPCSLISHFLLHLLSASTASLSIDMDSSTICHSTATLAIDTNAKAIDMALSQKEVFGGALSSAKISKPSSPSSSTNNDGTSHKEVSSDEEERH